MAKCIAPCGSAETRGRIGGIVHSSWRGASTIRAKASPAQPRSKAQLDRRATGTYLSRKWQSCEYQSAWNDYATTHPVVDWTGNSKRLTGHNWYVAVNARYFRAMGATLEQPPTAPAPDPVMGFDCTGDSGQISCAWTSPAGANDRVEIWLEGPHSPGRQPQLPKARYQAMVEGDTSPCVLSGLLKGNYAVYARAFSMVTGLVSTWVLDTATVT